MYNVVIIQNCLGTVYSKLKKFEDAEPMYIDALKIFKMFVNEDPKTYSYDISNAQNNLGNLFMFLENFERAEYYLNKALKSAPTNIDILYNRACLESLRNNQEKALELLTKVIKVYKIVKNITRFILNIQNYPWIYLSIVIVITNNTYLNFE